MTSFSSSHYTNEHLVLMFLKYKSIYFHWMKYMLERRTRASTGLLLVVQKKRPANRCSCTPRSLAIMSCSPPWGGWVGGKKTQFLMNTLYKLRLYPSKDKRQKSYILSPTIILSINILIWQAWIFLSYLVSWKDFLFKSGGPAAAGFFLLFISGAEFSDRNLEEGKI